MTGRRRVPGGSAPPPRPIRSVVDAEEAIAAKVRAGEAHPDGAPRVSGHRLDREELLGELRTAEVKHSPQDILEIGRDQAGRIVFLETGNSRAGLVHIRERHAGDFANVGIPEDRLGEVIFVAVTRGTVVGAQRTRPIYEVAFEGKTYKIAVSVGSNGYIVGANPVGH